MGCGKNELKHLLIKLGRKVTPGSPCNLLHCNLGFPRCGVSRRRTRPIGRFLPIDLQAAGSPPRLFFFVRWGMRNGEWRAALASGATRSIRYFTTYPLSHPLGAGARDPRSIVRRVRRLSPTNAARFARPVFRSFFPAWDRGVVVRHRGVTRLLHGALPALPFTEGCALGLSSMPCSPVLRAKLPLLWILRFHSPETGPADRVQHIPKFRSSSKSPVCGRFA